jgi:predicted nucleotidyltransferase component of viral defense system
MTIEAAVGLARERARQLRVDPQVTVSEVYEAELLRRLQKKLRGQLVWKGGTVLRLEGSERFSRDLDATGKSAALTARRLKKALSEVGKDLSHLAGIEVKTQPRSLVALYRFSVPGLGQPLRISVEVSFREKILLSATTTSTARIAHPVGLEPVVVLRLDSRELLAEKVRALVVRLASRDIYDVYWLLQRGVQFDPALFIKKMHYYQEIGQASDPIVAMKRALQQLESYNPSRAKADLANLLPAARRGLDFAVIVEDVARALETWISLVAERESQKGKRKKSSTY